MNKIKQSILAIVIGLVLSAGVSYAAGVWQNPACGPTGCNTDTPINTGPADQIKAGALRIGNPTLGFVVDGASSFKGQSQFLNPVIFKGQITIEKSPISGGVLTSDASGNASWQTPAVSSSYSPMIDIKSKTCSPSSAECEVACISGYTLVSGGFKGEKQMASYPTNSSWRTIAWDYSGSNDTTIYAVCIKK